ncbi:MAG: hypothetical protein WAO91_00330 [Candidatus Nitrosotenuis sp.]
MSTIYFKEGFLPLGTRLRGILIGVPAAILPITAFFLTRKIKSRFVGLLNFAIGTLMMGGALASATLVDQSTSDLESFTQNIAAFLPVVGLGMFIVILGISKLND